MGRGLQSDLADRMSWVGGWNRASPCPGLPPGWGNGVGECELGRSSRNDFAKLAAAMLKTFIRLLSIKPILITFLILVGGVLVGSYLAYDHYIVKEPPVELVKSRLWGRIEDKSHLKKFDGGIKLAEEKDVAAAIVAMHKQYDSATTWQMMYQFFGEHLWQAEQMLKSEDAQKQQDAIRIMGEIGNRAARSAYRDGASDAWIGARIAQAYFMPEAMRLKAKAKAADKLAAEKAAAEKAAADKLAAEEKAAADKLAAEKAAAKLTNAVPVDPKAAKLAEKAAEKAAAAARAAKAAAAARPNRGNLARGLTEETLVRAANRLYETAGEIDPVFRNYQFLIRQASTNQVVPLRLEFARVLENYDRLDQAMTELSQITNTNLTAKSIERLKSKIKQRNDG